MTKQAVVRKFAAIVTIFICLTLTMVLTSCGSPGRQAYQRAMDLMAQQEYGPAVEEFDKALAAEPEMKMAVFGKARALFELKDYEPALALFEEFLVKTEDESGTFKKERWDSEFYRDKCKQELGMEVLQNEDAIPEPRMGE